jgi:hypothetical protein
MTQKTKLILLNLTLLTLLAMFLPASAMAACAPGETCGTGTTAPAATSGSSSSTSSSNQNSTQTPAKIEQINNDVKNNYIVKDLNKMIAVLSAGVGIVVVTVIIIGGIQYSIAGDNSTATKAARDRIMNGLIALFAFMLIFAFLQWLVPGGVF